MLYRLIRVLREDEGATAVEYAVMLALILMICFVAITTVGQNTATLWSDNSTGLQQAFNTGS